MKKKTSKYDGWLVSDEFWKRALAVWGHATAGYFFIVIFAAGIWAVLAILAWLISLI